MSKLVWRSIIESKSFYIRTYRLFCKLIIISLTFNILLFVAIIYLYINQAEPDYYATSGITAPVLLQALDVANDLSNPLLPPDQTISNQVKFIPE